MRWFTETGNEVRGAGAIVEDGLKYSAEKGFEDVVDGTRILPSVEACR